MAAELYQNSAELQPRAKPLVKLAGVMRHLNRMEESARFAEQAHHHLSPDDYYNLACLESIAGNVEAALEHLRLALEKDPGQRKWAKRGPDLEWIRGDKRFWEVVG
jgi:tetratricopeptide (TPR) repeat protein